MIFETMSGFLVFEGILLVMIVSFWAIAGLSIKFDWPEWIWMGSLVLMGWCALTFQGAMVIMT